MNDYDNFCRHLIGVQRGHRRPATKPTTKPKPKPHSTTTSDAILKRAIIDIFNGR